MKNPPFDSLVWGSLRLAPIITHHYIVVTNEMPVHLLYQNFQHQFVPKSHVLKLAECVALWGEPEQTVAGVSNH